MLCGELGDGAVAVTFGAVVVAAVVAVAAAVVAAAFESVVVEHGGKG